MKSKKKKILWLTSLTLVVVTSVTGLVVFNNKGQEGIREELVIDLSEKNYRKVYLLDENKFLIPLSVNVHNREYLVDEIYTIVSDLRDLKVEGFNNVLNENVKINKIELENGILSIDFSKEFLDYESGLEEKIIESLTWSVLDFKEVDGLTISVEGVKLKEMPLNKYQLPDVLNKEIGINKYHDLMQDFKDSDSVVLLYEKEVNGNAYLVPVTRRVIKENNLGLTILGSIDKSISLLSGLKRIDEVSKNIVSYDGNEALVSVSLDKGNLIEDSIISDSIYKILMITFEYNNLDLPVNFYVEEESVSVCGYQMEDMSVSKLTFNEVEI